MMNGAGSRRTSFEVLQWSCHEATLSLRYSAGERTFVEVIEFPAPLQMEPWLERVIDLLAIVASVSYAKAFAPTVVAAPSCRLTSAGRSLVESAFMHGMAEFSFTTGIARALTIDSTAVVAPEPPSHTSAARPLIPMGGGRDSAVVACAVDEMNPTLMSIGGGAAAQRVAESLGHDLVVVKRTIDPQIVELNAAGAPNGHIPITAITMLISVLSAAALGADCVVMANEASASSATRHVDGVAINHQYSKSYEFEMLLHDVLVSVASPVLCFSLLRDRDDTEISRVFADKCTATHHAVVSCNRANVRDTSQRSAGWCRQCPKCRSVYLSLAPHMEPDRLSSMFGQDLLADPGQTAGFADLLDESTKPFECVQTVDEARAAILALTSSTNWSEHAVVEALAVHGAARHTATPVGLGDHVPEPYRAQMMRFFS